jgi:hypothetical protein
MMYMGARMLHHRLHAVIYPAPDLPGEWVAHCLELDLVTQGTGALHACEMMNEAIRMVAEERIAMGLPPFEFRSAPPEAWQRLETAESIATGHMRFESKPMLEDVTIAPFVARAS